MPSSPSTGSLRRLVALLGALVLLPLAVVLGAAPAQATTNQLDGSVQDSLDNPLSSVSVQLVDPTDSSQVDSTTTDVNGDYSLADVAQGEYELRFVKAGFTTVWYGGGTHALIVIDEDGNASIDGTPVDENLLDTVVMTSTATHAITGKAVKTGAVALSGIHVAVYDADDHGTALDQATTGAPGTFSFTLPVGVYHVELTDPAHNYLSTWYDGTPDGGDTPADITLSSDQALGNIQMTPPAPNTKYPIAGRLVDANGDGINDATATVTGVGGTSNPVPNTDTTKTVGGEAGGYSVSVLPGTYQVSFSKTHFQAKSYAAPDTAGASIVTVAADGQLSVSPVETLTDNKLTDFTLPSTAYAVPGKVVISGSSTGISGMTVRAFPDGSTAPADVVDTDTTAVTTGAYSLDLPIGTYNIQSSDLDGSAPNYTLAWIGGASPVEVRVGQDGALTVNGSSVAGLPDIEMTAATSNTTYDVIGEIDDVNGDPIDGLTLTAVPQGSTPGANQATADTGADGVHGAHGRYRLALKAGTYQIHVDGGADFADAVYTGGGELALDVVVGDSGTITAGGSEVVGGELAAIELDGTATYTLSGAVKNASDTALTGITVSVYAEGATGGAPVATDTTDGSGYSVQLPVGTYVLKFTDSDGLGTQYVETWFGGDPAKPVKIAQGGSAVVDSAPVASNILPAVTMQAADANTTYALTGQVTDVNGDPIDGATVTAVPQGATPVGNQKSDTSDTGGNYDFALKTGTYRVTYSATGFSGSTYPGPGQTAVDIVIASGGTITAGGAAVTDGALGDVALLGTANVAISGVVQNASSTGLTGITVTIYSDDDQTTEIAHTTTSSGAYSFSTLKIGTYVLKFTDSDGLGTQYVEAWYGGGAAPGTSVKIAQDGKAYVGGSPVLSNALGTTTLQAADANTTYPLVGDVTDVNGDELQGVTVTAVPQSGTPGGNQDSDTTNSAGHYALDIKTGTYRVTFHKTNFTDRTYTGDSETAVDIVVASGGTITAGGVAVTGGELQSVELDEAAATHTLSGTVHNASSGNLSGITVRVYNEGATSEAPVATDTTDGSGYSVQLKIGTYVLKFTDSDGNAPQYVETYFGGGAAPGTSVKIAQNGSAVVSGSPVPSNALPVVTMQVATSDTLYPLSGEVDDVNGDPLSGITVTAVQLTGSPVSDLTETTDVDGHFTLGLKQGTYQVKYSATGYPQVFYPDPDSGDTATITVASGGVMTIGANPVVDSVLDAVSLVGTAVHPVTGHVLKAGGLPLSGITVQAFVQGEATETTHTTSASDGSFTLQLPVGTYTVTYVDNVADATTYATTWYDGTDDGGTTGLGVKVATGGALSDDNGPISDLGDVTMTAVTADVYYDLTGTVYDPNFDPLPGATVEVIPVAGTPAGNAGSAVSDGDGTYRIPTHPGKYNLRFSKSGLQTTYLAGIDDPSTPATVTIAPNGSITAPGLDMVGGVVDDVQLLVQAAPFSTDPKLTGKVVVGQTVTATLGALSGASIDTDSVTFEWFLDGRPADDYSTGSISQKFKIPAVAATKKLSFKLTIDDPDGLRASSVFTSKSYAVPKAPASVKGVVKKGKLTATVKVPGLAKPTGKLVVKDGKKTIATITIKTKAKGKVVINLSKLKPGKHKLTLLYSGTKTINKAKSTVKVTVKKR